MQAVLTRPNRWSYTLPPSSSAASRPPAGAVPPPGYSPRSAWSDSTDRSLKCWTQALQYRFPERCAARGWPWFHQFWPSCSMPPSSFLPDNVVTEYIGQFNRLVVTQSAALELVRKIGDAGAPSMDYRQRPYYLAHGRAFLHDMSLYFVAYVHAVCSPNF